MNWVESFLMSFGSTVLGAAFGAGIGFHSGRKIKLEAAKRAGFNDGMNAASKTMLDALRQPGRAPLLAEHLREAMADSVAMEPKDCHVMMLTCLVGPDGRMKATMTGTMTREQIEHTLLQLAEAPTKSVTPLPAPGVLQ